MSVKSSQLPSAEELLEVFYHHELGYGLFDGEKVAWTFSTAYSKISTPINPELSLLRLHINQFIERGYGKFDEKPNGQNDPVFRISQHGIEQARIHIVRRKPWYNLERIQLYDWSFWSFCLTAVGVIAAILAAIFAYQAIPNSKTASEIVQVKNSAQR